MLHQDGQVAAAHLAREEIDGSTKSALNAKKFVAEFCQPLKMAEEWIARKKQQFGSQTTDANASFRRVEAFLFSNRGRIAVLGCIAAGWGSKLEGNGRDSGIEACRIVHRELQQAKNPPPPQPAQPASSTDGHAPGTGDAENDSLAAVDDLAPAGSVAAMDADDESEPEGAGLDAVEAAIKEKVDKAVEQFVIENDLAKMEQILKPLMTGSSTRLLFILDAPTSRAKIVTAMIDQVGELLRACNQKDPPEVHVLAPCGTRLDLLSGVANRMGSSCPSLASFTLQLTHQAGSQKLKRRAAFAQYGVTAATLKAARSIPTSIPALAARLSPGEYTRLRCVSSACKLRSAPATEDEMKAISQDPSAEIAADDKVETGVEDMQDAEQGGVATDEDLTPPDMKRDCVSDLWPFAFGKDFYKAMVQELLPGLAIHHWIVLTTSAHPSVAVAGHEMGAKVYVFHDRVSAHAAGHGHELLRLSFERTIAPAERRNVVKAEKRMRDEDFGVLCDRSTQRTRGPFL